MIIKRLNSNYISNDDNEHLNKICSLLALYIRKNLLYKLIYNDGDIVYLIPCENDKKYTSYDILTEYSKIKSINYIFDILISTNCKSSNINDILNVIRNNPRQCYLSSIYMRTFGYYFGTYDDKGNNDDLKCIGLSAPNYHPIYYNTCNFNDLIDIRNIILLNKGNNDIHKLDDFEKLTRYILKRRLKL